MTHFVTRPVARKEHACSLGQDTIKPGERYVRDAWAPWAIAVDDPDSSGFPLGGWDVQRYHQACHDRMTYGVAPDPWEPEGGYPPPPF